VGISTVDYATGARISKRRQTRKATVHACKNAIRHIADTVTDADPLATKPSLARHVLRIVAYDVLILDATSSATPLASHGWSSNATLELNAHTTSLA
jgi:hypothetical protein